MSFFRNRRVLVTGASGLIGSHAVEELRRRGAQVVGTLHSSRPVIEDSGIEYRRVDLSRKEDCATAVQGCEMAIIAAANTSGALMMRDNPVVHITENLLINAQLLEAAWRAGVERVLFVSSSTVYPLLDHPRKEEEAFLGDPHPTYMGVGWMKRYIEKLCAFYTQKFGMKCSIVRPTNVYGPRDKFDFKTSHVLPALIRRAVEGADPFEVWGDGTAVRDFIYVTDMTEALLRALETQANAEGINVGSGEAVTIRESVELILKLTGRTGVRVVFDASKPTTIQKQSVDISKARALLGFQPKVSFEEGMGRTIEWYKRTRNTVGAPQA